MCKHTFHGADSFRHLGKVGNIFRRCRAGQAGSEHSLLFELTLLKLSHEYVRCTTISPRKLFWDIEGA